MKFQFAFALLAIFGAAQAGKNMEVMTFGSGYSKDVDGTGSEIDGEGDGYGEFSAAATSEIVRDDTEQAREATDDYSTKSNAYSDYAKFYQELAEEKRHTANEYRKRSSNLIARANEAYKNSQLHRRAANDKQTIAKEYEHRAMEHDKASKQQDIMEMDTQRKDISEWKEHVNNAKRANAAAANSALYAEEAQAEYDLTSEYENQAKELYSKAEQYDKQAAELKDKSKKEKEEARAYEAKGKEEEARAADLENAFVEASKKVNSMKYYAHEFRLKGESERHLAEGASIRAISYALLANLNKEHSQLLSQFANLEYRDYQTNKKRSIDIGKQKDILTKSAAHMFKSENFEGANIYGNREFPSSSYHGA